MRTNMGRADRIIRILLAVVLAGLYFGGAITGTVGIVLIVLAGAFVLTGAISICPAYALLGVNTFKHPTH